MNSLTQFINESMLKHICIELRNNNIIYEKYGLYKGSKELAEYIYSKLSKDKYSNELTISYDEVKHIDNIVFDRMIVIRLHEGEEEGYSPNKDTKINKGTGRFEEVILKIKFDSDIYLKDKIENVMIHELTHLYNDYKIQLSTVKSLYKLVSNDKIYQNSKKHVILKRGPLAQFMRAIYYLNPYEQNAFMASLTDNIERIKEKFAKHKDQSDRKDLGVSKIFKVIKSSEIYQNYQNVVLYIELWDNGRISDEEIRNIESDWSKMFHENINANEIFKKLKERIKYVKRKLEIMLPKKIIESIERPFCMTYPSSFSLEESEQITFENYPLVPWMDLQ